MVRANYSCANYRVVTKRQRILMRLLFVSFLIAWTLSVSIEDKIQWREFLTRSDPLWVFNAKNDTSMPTLWFDSPFHGNGMLGMLILAERVKRNGVDKYIIRFDIGRVDVWDVRMKGTKYAYGDSQVDRCRLQIGHFELETVGEILEGSMRINLFDANVTGVIKTTSGSISFTTMTFSSEHLMLIDLYPTEGEKELSIQFIAEHGICDGRYLPDKYVKNPLPECTTEKGIAVCQHRLLERGDYATAYVIQRDSVLSHIRVLSTIDNSIPANILQEETAKSFAVRNLQRMIALDMNQLLQAHSIFWHEYYKKSFLSIPDMKWESFYWIQMYKVGSATRCTSADNCWPYDLMGPWYRKSVWSDYHFDMNIEVAAWPLWTANHAEEFVSMLRLLEENMERIIQSVPPEYQDDCGALSCEAGWEFGCDAKSYTANNGYMYPPGAQLSNLGWTCQILWTHYQYTQNSTMLKQLLYPMLRMSNNYYTRLAFLRDGKYHLPIAQSPEYGNAEDTVIDLSLFRWGVQLMKKLTRILHIEEPMMKKWESVIANLTDYPSDEDGLLVGAGLKMTSMHRHWSHLFPIYPLHLMDHEVTPELDEFIAKSLDHWTSFKPTDNGFSIAASTMMNLMIPNRDEVGWNELNKAWGLSNLGKATFYWESSHCPVNESPFGLAAGLQYSILRSDTGNIDVFPKHIKALKDVVIHQLRAEGGFSVSGVKKEGITQWVYIKSLYGNECVVRIVDFDEICVTPADVKYEKLEDHTFRFDLQKDEEVYIYSKGLPRSFVVEAIPEDPATIHAWGLH